MVQFPKPRYTQEQKRRLLELSDIMRDCAARIGPMHSWWEYITDVLRFLEGQETVLSFDAEGWIEKLTGMLTQKCIEGSKYTTPSQDTQFMVGGKGPVAGGGRVCESIHRTFRQRD